MYELIIKYDQETNKFEVDGPLKHAILCYGMLERAKDIVRAGAGVGVIKAKAEEEEPSQKIEVIDKNDPAVKDLLKTVPGKLS